jgi:hypothetical protein
MRHSHSSFFLSAPKLSVTAKLRENSIVQVVLRAIEALKPHRTEDDKIQRIKDTFK